MCTLLVATRRWPGTPLLIAANRDEHLQRPAAPPSSRRVGSRRIFAPTDLRAGGTWMGLNDAGLFVAITNRFAGEAQPPEEKQAVKASRGLLVEAALTQDEAAAASVRIASIDPGAYNGFHLLCADVDSAWVTWSDTLNIYRHELQPGLHVLTERSHGAAPSQREEALRAKSRELANEASPPISQLEEALRAHREHPMESTCVHLDDIGYGTRSSSIVRFGDEGPVSYRYAGGPPCRTSYEDLSQAMVRGLRSG